VNTDITKPSPGVKYEMLIKKVTAKNKSEKKKSNHPVSQRPEGKFWKDSIDQWKKSAEESSRK